MRLHKHPEVFKNYLYLALTVSRRNLSQLGLQGTTWLIYISLCYNFFSCSTSLSYHYLRCRLTSWYQHLIALIGILYFHNKRIKGASRNYFAPYLEPNNIKNLKNLQSNPRKWGKIVLCKTLSLTNPWCFWRTLREVSSMENALRQEWSAVLSRFLNSAKYMKTSKYRHYINNLGLFKYSRSLEKTRNGRSTPWNWFSLFCRLI